MDPRDLAFAGATEQARLLAAGSLTAPELLEVYLQRIDRLDPRLRSYRVVLAQTARDEAAAAQRRLAAGERLPLLGVPIAIKDDTDIAGQTTTFGTSAHGPAVSADAEVVRRLRAAGAVLIGKTAVPELMMFPYTESLTFGATANPWDLGRTPGGSSGGSAAAVAAGLAPLALGSDGGGSIRIPSLWCGLFGLKPQRDRVPLAPHDDAWRGLSVAGPIARSVADAALFLDVTADGAPAGGFVAAAAREPGRLRIAVSTAMPSPMRARLGGTQRRTVDEAAELLRRLGHQVIVHNPDYPAAMITNGYLARYFRGIRDDVRALPHPERLEARTRAMARIGALVSERRIAAVRAAEATIRARVGAIFDDVDVVLTPGNAVPPPRLGARQRSGALATVARAGAEVPYQQVWNVTGQPVATVPWGPDRHGLPVGVQLVGRPHDEATLLSLAAQIEKARPWADRRPPAS
ncbi:amidase [Mycobacterium sp. M1]|uniref:amidase n=1 Tax=Mycolicibacter acidiphilus TaxID=2835306 RepID=A0ABS5RM17_9MYCO|nr:amidase [Mycolicibacter acidiphilus]MBS9535348.1 amidase [Mycolicibacter acidiphilus]